MEELWFAEHGEGDLIALREKELQQRVMICTRRGLVLTIAANFTLILLQMMAIRNDDAPKPIGTSGNTEEATEPEDDEYQSDDSDDMDGEARAKPMELSSDPPRTTRGESIINAPLSLLSGREHTTQKIRFHFVIPILSAPFSSTQRVNRRAMATLEVANGECKTQKGEAKGRVGDGSRALAY